VFFISPCPAKVTEAHYPLGLKEPVIDGALSMAEVYKLLLPLMKRVKNPPKLRTAGFTGVGWASAGGEARPLRKYNVISCDGLENVIRLLDAIEDKFLPDVDYLELLACEPGCVGGCLTAVNPFAARARIMRLSGAADIKLKPLDIDDVYKVWRGERIRHTPTTILDEDFRKAIEKLKRIEDLNESLPGLDCGSCGSPGCHALAQDVVMGYAEETDCIFNARAQMEDGGDGQHYLPPPFRRR